MSECNCRECLKDIVSERWGLPITSTRMTVCSDCGNKRCPHATDHRNACTRSNAPGQPGSIYGGMSPPPGHREG